MELTMLHVGLRLAIYTCVGLAGGSLCSGQQRTVTSTSSTMKSDLAESRAVAAEGRAILARMASIPEKPIITIDGVCNHALKTNLVSPCRTVVSRTEFEHMIGTAESKLSLKAQREFAERYADALIMAHKAEQMRLNQGIDFEEEMKLARIQILAKELKQIIEKQASQVSEREVEKYYSGHREDFEQVEMERIHVPRYKDGHNEHTLPNDPEAQKQLDLTERTMKEAAEQLRERAISGDDLDELQKDAFDIAGIKRTVSAGMGKIRRASLPENHRWVMDLNTGEMSPVISDSNGFTIYKVKAKALLSLDQAREEIKGILYADHVRRALKSIQESATTILDESYFRKSFHQ